MNAFGLVSFHMQKDRHSSLMFVVSCLGSGLFEANDGLVRIFLL